MSIVVNTNVSSVLVQRSLGGATSEINKSLEKLSTGYRINKAADDAAGLTISESLRSQSRGAAVAQTNAQTGINMLQTAEGDLGVIQDNLQRVRDLSVQAANGTNSDKEKKAIKEEVDARVAEISRIAQSSSFNGVKLLDGSSTTVTLQIGSNGDKALNQITVGKPLQRADATMLGISNTSAFTDPAGDINAYIDKVDSAISDVSTNRSKIGSVQNRLDSAIKSLAVKQENMLASESRIRDVDVAKEAASLTKNQILQQASASLLSQANQSPNIALSLI